MNHNPLHTVALPTQAQSRLLALDALRGFALCGIMFINYTWFTGFAVLLHTDPSIYAEQGTLALDRQVHLMVTLFVDSKFWTIFSLLFGVGMGLQWMRLWPHGDATVHLRRRLFVLFGVGMIHGAFVWFGDIISLYAAVGFVWLIFAPASTSALWRCGLFFLALPILQAAIWLAFFRQMPPGAITPPDLGHGPPNLLPAFAEGNFVQVFEANWAYFLKRWLRAVYEGRFFKLLGMFLLGFWAARSQLISDIGNQRRRLTRIFWVGLIVGLPSNWFYASTGGGVVLPLDQFEFLRTVNQCIGIPALACAYVAAFLLVLAWTREWILWHWLAAVGRLSMTNYILQSLIGIGLFYGCGLGLWGSVGITKSFAIIAVIFAVQVTISQWWLQRYRFGPMEWLCRCLVYRKWLVNRRSVFIAPQMAIQENT